MLQITVEHTDLWDEINEEFISVKEQTIQLEHSLVSLSKWESKWCKSFFSKELKTYEEIIDYIKCMTLTKNVPPELYLCLSDENVKLIKEYIEAPMTATLFSDNKKPGTRREQITSELIYYWMISANIPFECQKWHLNRLLTLIRVCEIKNQPPKKTSKRERANEYAALNAKRRKELNTRG